MLGDAAGGVVEPNALVWEPSTGFLSETFFGRRVLFLAAPSAGAPRDVYRASVRLTLDGSPIHVTQVKNLTDTPHGDDVALEGDGRRVAFATLAFGRIQAISVLETAGVRDTDRPSGLLNRFLFAWSSFDKSGSFAGVGRTDIVLDVPARSAQVSIDGARLAVEFAERGRGLIYDLDKRTLRGSDGGEAYAARVVPEAFGAKPPLLWAVDTVRGVVGPRPIAWLENVVFGAKDSVKRTTYTLFAPQAGSTLKSDASETHARVLDASALKGAEDTWPPPKIPSLWKDPKPHEGEWEPVSYPFLKPMRGTLNDAGTPPPYFYRTFIRPDSERPYSTVQLVAMDTRQLELGMQAGYENPKPTTGPPGEGRLPREKEVYERVVATFNGAFKTTHGAYGMMVQGRVLLPPVKGGASVIVERRARNWPRRLAAKRRDPGVDHLLPTEPGPAGGGRRRQPDGTTAVGLAAGGHQRDDAANRAVRDSRRAPLLRVRRRNRRQDAGQGALPSRLRLRDAPRHEPRSLRLRVLRRAQPEERRHDAALARRRHEDRAGQVRALVVQGLFLRVGARRHATRLEHGALDRRRRRAATARLAARAIQRQVDARQPGSEPAQRRKRARGVPSARRHARVRRQAPHRTCLERSRFEPRDRRARPRAHYGRHAL
ncbi:MAG: hypothetical protein QM756_13615, partial [Polyangiaceae bacterium]